VLGGGLAQSFHAAAAPHVALHPQVQALHQRDRRFRFGGLVQRAVKLPVLEHPVVVVGLEAVHLVAQVAQPLERCGIEPRSGLGDQVAFEHGPHLDQLKHLLDLKADDHGAAMRRAFDQLLGLQLP
jgi:hypothetical protein